MAAVSGFRAAGALVAVVVALAPLLPAQHVHEAEEHGHAQRVVHQHLSSHALVPGVGVHVEDGDEPILTLTTLFTIPAHLSVINAPPAEVVAFVEPPPARVFHRSVTVVEPLIHGPPRAPVSARPPPFLPAV